MVLKAASGRALLRRGGLTLTSLLLVGMCGCRPNVDAMPPPTSWRFRHIRAEVRLTKASEVDVDNRVPNVASPVRGVVRCGAVACTVVFVPSQGCLRGLDLTPECTPVQRALEMAAVRKGYRVISWQNVLQSAHERSLPVVQVAKEHGADAVIRIEATTDPRTAQGALGVDIGLFASDRSGTRGPPVTDESGRVRSHIRATIIAKTDFSTLAALGPSGIRIAATVIDASSASVIFDFERAAQEPAKTVQVFLFDVLFDDPALVPRRPPAEDRGGKRRSEPMRGTPLATLARTFMEELSDVIRVRPPDPPPQPQPSESSDGS